MIWTDIQQTMYSTPNFFNNIVTNENNSNNTSLTTQSTKHHSLIDTPSYNSVGTNSISSSAEEDECTTPTSHRKNLKRKVSSSFDNNESEDNTDEKRKNFLERNRQAALKCRQRKKQWLNSLQERVEYLANDNEQLQLQANAMRDEVLSLRSLLMIHKDCHISTNNTVLVPQHQQISHIPIQQQLSQRQGNSNIGSTVTTKII